MQVILLTDIEKLGLRGDVVDVADGYGRNYLLPRRLAQKATQGALKDVQRRQELQSRHEAASAEQAQQIAGQLQETELRFEATAGPTGTLFGSVTPSEIADEIWRTKKIRVDRRKIGIDPIKRIGRYAIPIEIFQGVSVDVKTVVVPEGLSAADQDAAIASAESAAAAETAAAEAAEAAAAAEAAPPAEELIGEAEAAGIDVAVAAAAAQDFEPSDEQELDETPEMHDEERPDDEFDRAADSALEREGEEL
jgi:large subunit ribosomal protein L9